VQNNNYERDGETVYSMAFTAEEIDYLDTKAEGEALRGRQGPVPGEGDAAPASKPAAKAKGAKAGKVKHLKLPSLNYDEQTDPIPF
jgi:single-strand DNA-binding protein